MTGLSGLTFVLIAFCCYATIMSKTTRNETAKNVDIPHEQQHYHQLQSAATHETRKKRSELDFEGGNAGDYKDFNELIQELDDIVPVSQEMDLENMSPIVYYFFLQKMKQLKNNERQLPIRRTPRLGRSIDFQLFDAGAATSTGHDFNGALSTANDYAVPRHFLPHVMKKSVQFKPRLGKRTQVCN